MRLPCRVFALILSCLAVLSVSRPATASVYRGDSRFFEQPDGTQVEVRLFGTEFYMRAESPDGFTLAVDRATGWICYAEKAADGSLKSSGIHYLATSDAAISAQLAKLGIVAGLRADSAHVAARVAAARRSLGSATESPAAEAVSPAPAKYQPVLGSGKGLVVLVDFSDRTGSVALSEYDKAFNGDTYDSFGSMRTWIESISYGKYTASHTVVGYMRAEYPTTHYVGGAEMDYSASAELMKQVYAYIDQNVDLTSYATNGTMPSLVVIYPGTEIAKAWATGLWPHSGERGYTTSEGVRISNVFICNSGARNTLDLETYRHELGHSLFGWPDTYDYDDDSMGAGGFATETTLPCAPFRAWTGWMNVIDVVGLNQAFALPANGDTCLRYKNANNKNEYFVVEYMRKDSAKRPDAPDEGLLIWHIDESKNGDSDQDMTASKHYEVSVEQADGLYELEKNGRKRTGDLFRAGYKDTFNDTTTPNSKWWNGSASGFAVCNVGALDPSMNVTVGCSGTITPVIDAGAGGTAGSGGIGGRSGAGGMAGSGGGGAAGRTSGRDAGPDGQNRDAAGDSSLDITGQGRGGAGAAGTSGDARPGSGGSAGSLAGGAQATGGSAGGGAGSGGAAGTQGKGGSAAGGATAKGGAAGASAGSGTQAQSENGGCSCSLGTAGPSSTPAGLATLFLALLVFRRRQRK